MTTKDYYIHARSLGQFRAVDCLRMARECAAMDARANAKPPIFAYTETLPDGSGMMKLSNAVKVY